MLIKCTYSIAQFVESSVQDLSTRPLERDISSKVCDGLRPNDVVFLRAQYLENSLRRLVGFVIVFGNPVEMGFNYNQ